MDDLVYHIRRGNNKKAISIIDQYNLHPNEEMQHNGNTIMHFTAEYDNIPLLKQMTRRGGSPFVVNHKAEGLMHFAAREGHVDFLSYLHANHDVDIDQIMNDHWTPLFYA
jgi:ankyrin repeat protein